MKCIRVTIQKLEVEKFCVRDGVNLKMFFDDGGKKCLEYSSKLESVDSDVKDMLTKINVYEKSQNKVLDAENAFDSHISVFIENEEGVMDRMKVFLARLREQKKNLKSYGSHQGYIEQMNKAQKQVLEFNKR